jgi:hypothetical protein
MYYTFRFGNHRDHKGRKVSNSKVVVNIELLDALEAYLSEVIKIEKQTHKKD